MKIFHHIIVGRSTEEEKAAYAEAGLKLKDGSAFSFDISEDDPRWEMVSMLVARYRASDLFRTEFSPAELDAARFLRMMPSWYHGYPEPSDDNSFRELTYNPSDYCEKCGIGLRQVAPFRMKKAPVWGRRAILALNWIYDEFFVTPEVWGAIFKPLGVGCRPVVLNKNGAVLDSVVQLDVPTLVDLQLPENHPYHTCDHCGRRKYQYLSGYLPKPAPTNAVIFKSSQYFGAADSAIAIRLFIISSTLYCRIRDAALKGANFLACAE